MNGQISFVGEVAVISFVVGTYFGSAYVRADFDAYKQEQVRLVHEQEKENAKKLSEAVDSMAESDAAYNSIRAERDALVVRLRERDARSVGATDDSAASLRARNAALEKVVRELYAKLEECDRGWSSCAKKHDALVSTIK